MADLGDFELLLTEVASECARLEARVLEDDDALDAACYKRDTLKAAINIFRAHHRLPAVTGSDDALRQSFVGMTIQQVIVTLARQNAPPLFRGADMTRRLVQVGTFKDEISGAAGMYSIIGRHPKTFLRIGRGRYLVNPDLQGNEK